jgi:hypothetical protein
LTDQSPVTRTTDIFVVQEASVLPAFIPEEKKDEKLQESAVEHQTPVHSPIIRAPTPAVTPIGEIKVGGREESIVEYRSPVRFTTEVAPVPAVLSLTVDTKVEDSQQATAKEAPPTPLVTTVELAGRNQVVAPIELANQDLNQAAVSNGLVRVDSVSILKQTG